MKVKLKVILAGGFSHDWRCQGAALSIGRDPECDLAIEDSEERIVSWMHARIERDGDGALIRDFRSKNGTYVNEEPVDGTRPLQIGDTIQLGRKGPKLIVLELDAGLEEALPAPLPVVSDSAPVAGFAGGVAQRGFIILFHHRFMFGGGDILAGSLRVLHGFDGDVGWFFRHRFKKGEG